MGYAQQVPRKCAQFADATLSFLGRRCSRRGGKAKLGSFCISIVGPSAELVYFEKLDNYQFASVTISQHEARTAARYRRSTLVFETLVLS
jgi:uncharacterized protein GlcG (DUF336 family)